MSDADRGLSELVGELSGSLEQLQSELETGRGPRPPTPRQLAQFTSEVTIPAIILALETNVRALRLVQRSLRIAEGRDPTGRDRTGARERANELGRATVDRLDDVLTDLQSALDGRPPDDEARELVDRVRDLRAEIDAELAAGTDRTDWSDDGDTEPVDIDVDEELRSIKDDVDANSDEGNEADE